MRKAIKSIQPNQLKWLQAAPTGLLCASTILSSSMLAAPVLAQTAIAETAKPAPKVKKIHKKNVVHRNGQEKAAVGGPVYKDAPKLPEAPPACSAASAEAINKTLGVRGWAFPAPDMGDSLTLDYDCWRTNLAKLGFGLVGYNLSVFASNIQNHYVPPTSQQQYWGQKASGLTSSVEWLTYDLSRYGLPDGQISVAGQWLADTYSPVYSSNTLRLAEVAIHGTAFNKTVEYNIGLLPTSNYFQGTYVGGTINNPLGPAASSGVEAGNGVPPEDNPAIDIKWNITPTLYFRSDVERSLPGSTATNGGGYLNNSGLAIEEAVNPSGTNLFPSHPCAYGTCYHSPSVLLIDELGYENQASPGNPFTWIRLTGFYNFTRYENLQYTNTTTDNYAITLYGDRQIWQAEPNSPYTAYKGVYIGGTIAYNDPQAAALSNDYEVRIYSFGLFGRPRDQLALSFQHLTTSKYLAWPYDASTACQSQFNVCIRNGTNSVTLSYTANIMSGVYATLGAQYIDHPGVLWSPWASSYGNNGTGFGSTAAPIAALAPYNIQHSLNFLASLFVAL